MPEQQSSTLGAVVEGNERFRYQVVVQQDRALDLYDLPGLMAKAIHPYDGGEFAGASASLVGQLTNAARIGELVPRRRVDMKKWEGNDEDLFATAVLELAELRSFLKLRGMGLLTTPHGSGPELWTIRNVALDIGAQQRMGVGPMESFKQALLDSVETGDLRARSPLTLAPADGLNVLDCWELLRPLDVQRWLQIGEAPYTWSPASGPTGTPLRGAHLGIRIARPFPVEAMEPATRPVLPVAHSTVGIRRNVLASLIEQAQLTCRNPMDSAEVWMKLTVMASERVPPLLGVTEEGLQYLKNGDLFIFTRAALKKRLVRATG